MKEGPGKRDILSRPASKKAAARPRSAPRNEPKPVPVPLPEGVRHQRVGETTERSTPAHLKKLKQLFEAAPISRYLGMTLSYCENGVARVRLPFRAEFEERHGVIHGGLIGLLADTAGNFAVGSVSPGSTGQDGGVQDELAGGSPGRPARHRRGRPQGTHARHLPARGRWGQQPCGGHRAGHLFPPGCLAICTCLLPWCTTPIEAESSLGPDSHHPVISLSGIRAPSWCSESCTRSLPQLSVPPTPSCPKIQTNSKTRAPVRRRVHLSLSWRAQPSRAWQRLCVFGHDALRWMNSRFG